MIAPSVFLLEVRTISVEVPVGIASGSEKMWSYLDEERSQAVRSATMAQNGVRLGVAPQSVGPDLVNVLQEMTGRTLVVRTELIPPGTPLAITLQKDQDLQKIFVFARDRTLSGQTYPPGDNLLILSISLNEMDYSKLIVTGVPQIRGREKLPLVRDEPGVGPTLVYESKKFTLDACTFQLTLANGEILVVGPGAESRQPYSVGRNFLVHEKDGLECETILVIVPTIRKVQVKTNVLVLPAN